MWQVSKTLSEVDLGVVSLVQILVPRYGKKARCCTKSMREEEQKAVNALPKIHQQLCDLRHIVLFSWSTPSVMRPTIVGHVGTSAGGAEGDIGGAEDRTRARIDPFRAPETEAEKHLNT